MLGHLQLLPHHPPQRRHRLDAPFAVLYLVPGDQAAVEIRLDQGRDDDHLRDARHHQGTNPDQVVLLVGESEGSSRERREPRKHRDHGEGERGVKEGNHRLGHTDEVTSPAWRSDAHIVAPYDAHRRA